MMQDEPLPRLRRIDLSERRQVLNGATARVRSCLELIRREPGRLEQIRHSSLESDFFSRALESYALGLPLDEVRQFLGCAALAGLRVAELRGTEEAFSVVEVVIDRSTTGHITAESRAVDRGRDYSLGNSAENFRAVTAALAAGDASLARRISAFAWDPPNADYIGPKSFCTLSDQRIAYAVRHLLAGEIDRAADELLAVNPANQGTAFTNHGDVAMMIRALIIKDGSSFLEGLSGLLEWHAKVATRKSNLNDPEHFLCLSGLGLSTIALRCGLVDLARLPRDDPHFPLELMASSLNSEGGEADIKFD